MKFKLSSLTTPRIINIFRTIIVIPGALLFRILKPNIWIISERYDQARDNGFIFYKYLKEQQKDQVIYYIIDRNSADARKIEHYGTLIQYNSWKHYFFYFISKVHISAHVGGCSPKDNPFAGYIRKYFGIKNVFLPHGVSYGISDFCLAKYGNIDLFITSGKPEYDNILKYYGYSNNQVAYTGFPRLDEWHHIQVKPYQIVLMPTWRLYLAQNSETVFEDTAYYKAYQNLINNSILCDYLLENNLHLVFYLHHNMRKYVNSFHTECSNIYIAYRDEDYDIQELLKESALLITDYSSVHFDFAYMGKPVLYYQFDREEFWEKQYKQSDFDAVENGFGPVAYDQTELINNLKQAYKDGFRLKDSYLHNMEKFYVLHDTDNCKRVYDAIIGHFK